MCFSGNLWLTPDKGERNVLPTNRCKLKSHEIQQHTHLPGPEEIHRNKSLGSVSRGRWLEMSRMSIQGRVMQQLSVAPGFEVFRCC